MALDPVSDWGIYPVDVPMFGMSEVTSPYVVDAAEPAIIDTGPAHADEKILSALADVGIDRTEVSYIVPTHAHLDHAGSAGYLADACENATVVCHERAVEYLTDESKLERLTKSVERAIGMPEPYGDPTLVDRERCRVVSGGERLGLGDRTLELIDAPGHAPHQLCLADLSTGGLFTADAAGMNFPETGLRPTTPPPNFDLEDALATIDRLLGYEPDRLLYAHFGPGERGAGVAELESYREMLPTYVERIRDARDRHGADVSAITADLQPEWSHWSLSTDVAGVLRYLDRE
ncbi:MAG: MBL fold metallo-hydrolase [Natronomonas sp.]